MLFSQFQRRWCIHTTIPFLSYPVNLLRNISTKTAHAGTVSQRNVTLHHGRKPLPFIIFILGGPGSGKGTQCLKIARDYQFMHLSVGDLLRQEPNVPGSPSSTVIHQCLREGTIVPRELTFPLILRAMEASGNTKFLIDGFPRNVDQATAFEAQVAPSQLVLYLKCKEEELLQRLIKRGEFSARVDDNRECIQKRFHTFQESTVPVIEKYRILQNLAEVSGSGSPEHVYYRIRGVLDALKIQ